MESRLTSAKRWRRAATVLTTAICVLITRPTRAQQSDWSRKFDAAWTKAQAAEAARNWSDAARLYADVIELLPDESTSRVALARAQAHLNRLDDALANLALAVELGWNDDDQLRSDPAFTPLRDRPAFKQLIARIDQIEREPIVVYVPPRLDPTSPAPLILAFHGRGENPHYFIRTWKQAADDLGAVVAAPRAPHRVNKRLLNVWELQGGTNRRDASDIDLDAARRLTREAIDLAGKNARIDPKRIILTGYSQGGAVALDLLTDDPSRYAGALVQASLYKSLGADRWKKAATRANPRVAIIAHQLDPLRPRSEDARTELVAAGIPVLFELVENVGHEPPADNPSRQAAAVRYILAIAPTASRPAATPTAR